MLVCWSGGCDSTLVLYNLAKEIKEGRKHGPLHTISISHSQILAEVEQRNAREKILKAFKRLGLPLPSEVDIKIDASGVGMNHHGNPQAVVWLYASQCLEESEDLYSGYIRGDDFWQSQTQFAGVFDNLQQLAERTGKWEMPLKHTTKREVIQSLKQAGLYHLVWWCANPKKGRFGPLQCGTCASCVTHAGALAQQATLDSEPGRWRGRSTFQLIPMRKRACRRVRPKSDMIAKV